MVTQRQARILGIVKEYGPIHLREIGERIGSLNHLTEDLALLKSQLLIRKNVVANRHEYVLTERGKQALREPTSELTEDLAELHKILSGRLVVKGNYRFELREDGTVQKFSMRNPDGTWWIKDQRTEEEKRREKG